MAQRQKNEQSVTPKKSSGRKGASKKAYYAKGPAQLAKNQAAAAKRVARRKAYWMSPEGQARKFAKMNTPAKLKKIENWKLARDARRRDRKETARQAA